MGFKNFIFITYNIHSPIHMTNHVNATDISGDILKLLISSKLSIYDYY